MPAGETNPAVSTQVPSSGLPVDQLPATTIERIVLAVVRNIENGQEALTAVRQVLADADRIKQDATISGGCCVLCGAGVLLGTGEHIRDDLSPCFGRTPSVTSDHPASGDGNSTEDPWSLGERVQINDEGAYHGQVGIYEGRNPAFGFLVRPLNPAFGSTVICEHLERAGDTAPTEEPRSSWQNTVICDHLLSAGETCEQCAPSSAPAPSSNVDDTAYRLQNAILAASDGYVNVHDDVIKRAINELDDDGMRLVSAASAGDSKKREDAWIQRWNHVVFRLAAISGGDSGATTDELLDLIASQLAGAGDAQPDAWMTPTMDPQRPHLSLQEPPAGPRRAAIPLYRRAEPKKANEIVVVRGGNCVGVYVNGSLVCEENDSELHSEDLLAITAAHQPFTVRNVLCDSTWIKQVGSLPEELSDVVLDDGETPPRTAPPAS